MSVTPVPYRKTTCLTDYYPIPRSLLEEKLPLMALLIYGMLLDRATLSRKNDYRDESGWIFVVFPVLELRDLLGCSTTSVKDHLKALEDAGLIRRTRRSRREASRIFLLVPKDSVTDTLRDENPASQSRKSGFYRAGKVAPNNRNKQQDIINYEQLEAGESL